MIGIGDDVHDIIDGGWRKIWVQSSHRFDQAILQDDNSVVIPLWIVSVGRDVHAVGVVPARLAEPVEGKIFELVFCDNLRFAPKQESPCFGPIWDQIRPFGGLRLNRIEE